MVQPTKQNLKKCFLGHPNRHCIFGTVQDLFAFLFVCFYMYLSDTVHAFAIQALLQVIGIVFLDLLNTPNICVFVFLLHQPYG